MTFEHMLVLSQYCDSPSVLSVYFLNVLVSTCEANSSTSSHLKHNPCNILSSISYAPSKMSTFS